jgi:hypothetical protein
MASSSSRLHDTHPKGKMTPAERYESSRVILFLSRDGVPTFRGVDKGDMMYLSIFDFLVIRLGLDGPFVWWKWLSAEFEAWVFSLGRLANVLQLSSFSSIYALETSSQDEGKQLIWGLAADEIHTTPMTTFEGFRYILKLCVGKVLISEASAEEALLHLSVRRARLVKLVTLSEVPLHTGYKTDSWLGFARQENEWVCDPERHGTQPCLSETG